jgi:outer membrane protein OmpA-like peptidoglycan-associated protein
VARANRVRDYLESKGIDPNHMLVVGYSETRPVWSNGTEEGKARNCRVDVVVLRNRQVIDLGRKINEDKN